MTYDIRAHIPDGEGQGQEPGSTDPYEDCVLAGGALQGILFTGHDDWEPGAIRAEINLEDGTANTHGGEYFSRMAQFMLAHPANYPGLPPQSVETPPDLRARIQQAADAGWGMNIAVNCNAQAIINSTGPYQHCAVIAEVDDAGVVLWANGFYGGEVALSWAQLADDYAGALWVFEGPYPFLAATTITTITTNPQEDDDVSTQEQEVQWPDGHGEVFRLSGGTLQHIWEGADHQWSAWTNLVADDSGQGLARLDGWRFNADGTLEVFATASSGQVRHFRSAADGSWGGWQIGDTGGIGGAPPALAPETPQDGAGAPSGPGTGTAPSLAASVPPGPSTAKIAPASAVVGAPQPPWWKNPIAVMGYAAQAFGALLVVASVLVTYPVPGLPQWVPVVAGAFLAAAAKYGLDNHSARVRVAELAAPTP
ncbi:MAG TPA: hypothetical protein VIN56_10145 [Candidatus Dormibacteraeota bacterium]